MKPEELQKLRGSLLLQLLEIESERCKNHEDAEDRTDSFAHLLEGSDHVVERIRTGVEKYLALVSGVTAVAAPPTSPAVRVVDHHEASILDALRLELTRHGVPMQHVTVTDFQSAQGRDGQYFQFKLGVNHHRQATIRQHFDPVTGVSSYTQANMPPPPPQMSPPIMAVPPRAPWDPEPF